MNRRQLNAWRPAASVLRAHQYAQIHPIFSIAIAAEKIGSTFPAVAGAIDHMRRLGVMRQITGKRRHRLFAYGGAIRSKFGADYAADERTFVMGIDLRFTTPIAERFRNRRVLETCTGGGFTAIALARAAAHVTTVEIDSTHHAQARQNVATAGLADRVTFVLGDIMDERTWDGLPRVDAAFLDPDWAVTGADHVHRFVRSTTRPPADALLERTFRATRNVALVLPPRLDIRELDALPGHERQKLYMGQSHELYCLYFGDLAVSWGETILRV